MFENKNLSPRTVAAFSAAVIAVVVAFVFFWVKHWQAGLVALLITYVACYLFLNYIIQKFIYRKVKLIYKLINQTKATKKEETYYKYLLPRKSLDEVTEDVEAWAEQEALEIELLRKNEQYRKEFLQNLSHELKTPVFSIQGYLEILQQHDHDDVAMRNKYVDKATKNVERLVNLLRDLDEISKLEMGELQLHRQYFVVQDLVREVFDALSLKAEKRRIHFSIKKGCEAPLTVFADKEKIRQVLTNLVDNAIKYGKVGGHVVASIYDTDGRHVLVEVSDDGIGIPEKHLNRVFERFFRTGEGRSRDLTGTGLGLSICKHIVEAHGHTIHVRSKEGVGTTIGFTLDTRKKGLEKTGA